MYWAEIPSRWGVFVAISDGERIVKLLPAAFAGSLDLLNLHNQKQDHPLFRELARQFRLYEQGLLQQFTVPYGFAVGTVFQQNVWRTLATISYGAIASYSDCAAAIGNVSAVRAVASAIARNPLTIIIPCHRILGKNASLTGYAWGLSLKRELLELEQKNKKIAEKRI